MKSRHNQFLALTVTSAMIALSVIFCRFLGYSPEGTPFRFDLGFLPIALVAHLFGPIYSAAGYTIADIIGSLLSGYAPNPWLTLCQLLFGIIMGLCLYKRKITLPRIIICFTLAAVIIDFLAKSPVFVYLYAWDWGFTLWTRALNAAINLPIRIITFYFVYKALHRPMEKLL